MEIYYKKYPEYAIIYVKSGLERFDEQRLSWAFNELQLLNCVHVVLNLEETPFISSTIVGRLIEAWKNLNEAGGVFCLCNAGDKIMQVLEMTNIVSRLQVFSSEAAAIAFLKEEMSR